jgi:hypothetical protein
MKRCVTLIIIGFLLALQHIFLRTTRIINPSSEWNWEYDISGMLSVVGALIGIIGIVLLKKHKN